MEPRKLDWLGRVTQAIFIIACVTLVTISVLQYVRNNPKREAAREDILQGVVLAHQSSLSTSKTVLVYVSPGCPHCARSLDFYGRLKAAAEHHPDRWHMEFTSVEPEVATQKFLESGGLKKTTFVPVPDGLPTRSTPLLVVLDSGGKVLSSWLGRLDQEQEKRLLRLVGAN